MKFDLFYTVCLAVVGCRSIHRTFGSISSCKSPRICLSALHIWILIFVAVFFMAKLHKVCRSEWRTKHVFMSCYIFSIGLRSLLLEDIQFLGFDPLQCSLLGVAEAFDQVSSLRNWKFSEKPGLTIKGQVFSHYNNKIIVSEELCT